MATRKKKGKQNRTRKQNENMTQKKDAQKKAEVKQKTQKEKREVNMTKLMIHSLSLGASISSAFLIATEICGRLMKESVAAAIEWIKSEESLPLIIMMCISWVICQATDNIWKNDDAKTSQGPRLKPRR